MTQKHPLIYLTKVLNSLTKLTYLTKIILIAFHFLHSNCKLFLPVSAPQFELLESLKRTIKHEDRAFNFMHILSPTAWNTIGSFFP